jgi:hypothetical protein
MECAVKDERPEVEDGQAKEAALVLVLLLGMQLVQLANTYWVPIVCRCYAEEFSENEINLLCSLQ